MIFKTNIKVYNKKKPTIILGKQKWKAKYNMSKKEIFKYNSVSRTYGINIIL